MNSFDGFASLEITADDAPRVKPVPSTGNRNASMQNRFSSCSLDRATGVDDWDVSDVSNLSFTFSNTSDFDQDLNDWDVSNVERLFGTFQRAESFDGDISAWDVSTVWKMHSTFAEAESFDGDISAWDVSAVRDMDSMFIDATSFGGDLSQWDVSNMETMASMFKGAESFDGDVSDWDVSNVRNMARMFDGSGLTTENYDALLVAWSDLDLQEDVTLGAGDTQYSPGEPAAARQYLLDEYYWEIEDGGQAE